MSARPEPAPARPLLASRSQLAALRIEAHNAGDEALVDLCFAALDPDAPDHVAALTRCTEVIVEALGNDEPDLSTVTAIADMLGLEWAWTSSVRAVVNLEDWRLAAFFAPKLSWDAICRQGINPFECGTWDSVADIEATLRALGGVE